MPKYQKLTPPQSGDTISVHNGQLKVPDHPIIPFIEGDGTGPDIWRAAQRVFDVAVKKAYNGSKKIEWFEVFAGANPSAPQARGARRHGHRRRHAAHLGRARGHRRPQGRPRPRAGSALDRFSFTFDCGNGERRSRATQARRISGGPRSRAGVIRTIPIVRITLWFVSRPSPT